MSWNPRLRLRARRNRQGRNIAVLIRFAKAPASPGSGREGARPQKVFLFPLPLANRERLLGVAVIYHTNNPASRIFSPTPLSPVTRPRLPPVSLPMLTAISLISYAWTTAPLASFPPWFTQTQKVHDTARFKVIPRRLRTPYKVGAIPGNEVAESVGTVWRLPS